MSLISVTRLRAVAILAIAGFLSACGGPVSRAQGDTKAVAIAGAQAPAAPASAAPELPTVTITARRLGANDLPTVTISAQRIVRVGQSARALKPASLM